MSLKHAILGFLNLKPLSGYDLKKAFDQSVRHFWPANQSQIYRTLAQMVEEGLLEKEIIAREERLDLKIYQISPKGQAELQRWLATPLPTSENREPFLIQIFFGGQLSDEALLHLLHEQLKMAEERLQVYEAIYQANQAKASQASDPRALFLSMLTLAYGKKGDQALLAWLREAIEQIENKNYTF